jgi:hypothetical protein
LIPAATAGCALGIFMDCCGDPGREIESKGNAIGVKRSNRRLY